MKSDALLDYAIFQLSPRRSRCELFVSSDGTTEKLASGLVKPFVSHLQIAEEQVASAAQSVKLEVGRRKNGETWFTKGTLERFVRFVSTPEVLELVNTLDAEVSQLEAARKIYSQGAGNQLSGGGSSASGDDATKKELLRAIDVRLVAAWQDLSSACARAAAAGFNIHTVSELHKFADSFGAHRLNEACSKFASVNERRPEFTQQWRSEPDDRALRSSYGSDMSIDDDDAPPSPAPRRPPAASLPDPMRAAFSRESSIERGPENKPADAKDESSAADQPESIQASQPSRRLSVQDRINMFESKQKENSGGKPAVMKSSELRRLSSDVSSPGAVLRRWSGASDMSIDLSGEKKDGDSPVCNPVSEKAVSDVKILDLNDDSGEVSSAAKAEMKVVPSKVYSNFGFGESDVWKDQERGPRSFMSKNEDQESSEDDVRSSSSIGFGIQGKLRTEEFSGSKTQMTRLKDPVSPFEVWNPKESSESRVESVKEVGLKAAQKTAAASGVLDGGAGSRIRQAFASRLKGIEADYPSADKEVKPVRGTELGDGLVTPSVKTEIRKNVSDTRVSNQEDSAPQRLKFSRQFSASELNKKAQVQRDDASSSGKSSRAQFSGHATVTSQEGSDSFSTPASQSQRVRQSKGNQELDELKMKASELEKMFAEHKSRVPVDQPNSTRKGRLEDSKPSRVSKKSTKFDTSTPIKSVDSEYDNDAMNKKFSDLSVSESSRGKFYDRYMQKRDAKLRDDWSANREEKEARLKSMQDSLERSRSDMKAKIFGSADRRAKRLRSYNSRLIMKRGQQQLDFEDGGDDEEAMNKGVNDASSIDGVSRDSHGKYHLAVNRSLLSSPHTRSAVKSSTSSSGKRRMLPENQIARSVPNFSDMRKENTKPFGANKTTRSQARSYSHSKGLNDEGDVVREDKLHQSNSLRKSSANPSDFRDMPPMDSDAAEEIKKNSVNKPYLKKGSRKSFVAQPGIAREKASGVSEPLQNEEENLDMESEPKEFLRTVEDEGEDEFEILKIESQDFSDNGELKQRLEPESSENSGSENSDGDLTFSLVDQALGSKLPHWSGESPVSWNSHSLNEIDADAARMRKKWGTAEKPTLVVHSSNNLPRKDITQGFKRLLKFGRKNHGAESLVDWISVTTSEGDYDAEDVKDPANRSSEDLRKSRMRFSHAQASEVSFNECEYIKESGLSSQNSILEPPANFKLIDHLSGSTIKAPRSFFSLSTFRSKGSDSKL